jgi:hypothetical protein
VDVQQHLRRDRTSQRTRFVIAAQLFGALLGVAPLILALYPEVRRTTDDVTTAPALSQRAASSTAVSRSPPVACAAGRGCLDDRHTPNRGHVHPGSLQ